MNKLHRYKSFSPFLIFFSLFISGCNAPSTNDEKIAEISYINEQTIEVPLYDRSALCKYGDFIDSIHYVALEATDESIISYISKVEIANNGDYIILDKRQKKNVKNLKDGKNYFFEHFLNDIEEYAPINYYFKKATEQSFISSCDPSNFAFYCETKRQKNDTTSVRFEQFKALSNQNNPILIVCTLK